MLSEPHRIQDSPPNPIVRATIFEGLDGAHKISIHRLPQVYLSPKEALSIAREIHQYAIDAMRADGERADDQEGL